MMIFNSNVQLQNEVEKIYAECCEEAFGQWINGLFTWHPNLPFLDQKEAFFILLKRLLDDEKIVAFPPEEFYENGKPTVPCRSMKQYRAPDYPFDNIWNVPSEDVVQYMRVHWPNDVVDADDIKLNNFWFDNYCPRIGWYDEETDSIIAS